VNRAARVVAAALLAAALVAPPVVAPPSVLGWANAGDNYSTHDWVIDQAVKVLDGRAAWFDARLARLASNDPDVDRIGEANEHVYRGTGRRGGGVHKVAEHFDAAMAAYQAGDHAAASTEIGLLAHFVADLSQPYHTHVDAIGKDRVHLAYEGLIGPLHRDADDTPAWSSSRRAVSEITDIRATAIATAAYSRQYFRELHRLLSTEGVRLTSPVSTITGRVLRRAANDLADMIWSIERGTGAQAALRSLRMSVDWTGVRAGGQNRAYVRAIGVDGRPIEGLQVLLRWPTSTGSRLEYLYTDEDGRARRAGGVGTSPRLVLRPVTATATIRGVDTVASRAWTLSPALASGRAGFRTRVSDATVVAGQDVTVTSIARNASGVGVPNLLVTWTWDLGASTVRTQAYTDASGRASSTRTITVDTTRQVIEVTARTQSGSTNRSGTTSFRRVD
jgi:hypothetical protein